MEQAKTKKKLTLATQIFIALVLGIIVGICLTNHADFAVKYIKPFGTIFLNLVKWVVTPLVFFSIMAGVISMRDIRKVGSVGVKTIVLA
jgi:Na+/H+-dicarboxylate symporter